MNRLLYILLFFIGFQTQLSAQATINDYKYIIIPKQLEFLKYPDQYETSSLTKFLFNKYGYTAFFEDEDLPEDLSKNRCLALRSEIQKNKGFLATKVQFNLKDCNGNIVMTSVEGATKVKEYKKAYNVAIREAFVTFQFYNYKYVANENTAAKSVSNEVTSEAKEIEKLKKEVEALKAKKNDEVEVSEAQVHDQKPKVKTSTIAVKEVIEEVVELDPKSTQKTAILYAQPTQNGYQVVDMTPKVVMILLETSKANVFIVKDENAIVYKEDGFWYLSKYNGEIAKLTQLNLKF
ncbi:hypothetical protein [Psychroserpens damuponensis]|uniref:hypothetical protein n=1 Tax=Psychroserpens damuponensis TaxID=943936 RepID=UPI00058B9B97|nr:hypothetical protein [Psychroserpens damuponensis]